MEVFHIIALLVSISAFFGFLNHQYLKLPSTIGIMFITLVVSSGIVVLGRFQPGFAAFFQQRVAAIDFQHLLMDVMLSFLLFAGALHVDLAVLASRRKTVALFATIGMLISTALIGTGLFFVLQALGQPIPFVHALLFGALISPTDPIAVLSILKKIGVPKKLETKIVGESLFSDGVAVVLFLSLFNIAAGAESIHWGEIAELFLVEVGGGVALGLALGYIGYLIHNAIDDYKIEVLVTLAIVVGGYSLASLIHVSGPLAMVLAGLILGNHARTSGMSPTTEDYIDKFWEMLDEILNAVLFLLIGLELFVVVFHWYSLWAGLAAIAITLLARWLLASSLIGLMKLEKNFAPYTVRVMTWGGLRGGISVALALSLEEAMNRELLVMVTYVVVIFSILVQGLTIERVAQKLKKALQ